MRNRGQTPISRRASPPGTSGARNRYATPMPLRGGLLALLLSGHRRSAGLLAIARRRDLRSSARLRLARRAQASRALALVLLQISLADADRFRRDLDELVVGDEFDGV